MIQKEFADKVVEIVKKDAAVTGLAVAGSWITNELDEYSDLDLILITKEKISDDKTLCCHCHSSSSPYSLGQAQVTQFG